MTKIKHYNAGVTVRMENVPEKISMLNLPSGGCRCYNESRSITTDRLTGSLFFNFNPFLIRL